MEEKTNQVIPSLGRQIEREIKEYTTELVNIASQKDYSQFKLTRRISMFENKVYPTGKFDSQGNYKFWVDIISPRVMSEVKNVDFDTKDIEVYSARKKDALRNIIVNLKLKEYLRETGQAEEINSSVEEGSAWGNVVWKRVKNGYERVDLRNLYVINQAAKSLLESPVIERHEFSQSDLRAKAAIWNNVEDVIKELKKTRKPQGDLREQESTVPYYEIYERNGEVCLKDLKEAKSEKTTENDEKTYVLAKVIAAGTSTQFGGVKIKHILFADQISKMPYKEYHRGAYKGRWFREGLYELLFDLQVRANQVINQLAQGLEYASKVIFRAKDKLVVQNIITDMTNGDIIRSEDFQQVDMTLHGFSELANEWNTIINRANEIANSNDVIFGQSMPSGTSFRLGALLNQNSNKLYDFIRQKLAIPFSQIFKEWVVPQLVKTLKEEEVLRLTGDSEMLDRYIDLVVDDWYVKNLVAIGPHTPAIRDTIKQAKKEEIKSRPDILMKVEEDMWNDYSPHVAVVITGENSLKSIRLESLKSFIQLEADPMRRQALIEEAMSMVGIDAGALPKSPNLGQMPMMPTRGRTAGTRAARRPIGEPAGLPSKVAS